MSDEQATTGVPQQSSLQALRARFEQQQPQNSGPPPPRKVFTKQVSTDQIQPKGPPTPVRSNSPGPRPTPSNAPRAINTPSMAQQTNSPGDRQYRTKKPNGAADTPVSPSVPPPKSPLQRTASPNTNFGNLLANNNNKNTNENSDNNTAVNPIVSSLSSSNGVVPISKRQSPSPANIPTVVESPEAKSTPEATSEKPVITSEIPSPNTNGPTRAGSRVRSISDSTLRKLISDNHEILNQEKSRVSKIIEDATKRNQQIEMTESQRKERKNRINEILTTELQYLTELKLLTTFFLNPLRSRQLLPMLEISQLFANVEIIYEYCKDLAKLLEDHITLNQEYSAVGEILLSQVDNLAPAYSNYCSNHSTALVLLERLKGRKKFTKFVAEVKMNPEITFELDYYLVTPVQRICRYPLLLSELIKCTQKEHPDLESLTKAHSKLSHLVSVVNENSREQNNMKRLKEISEALGNQSNGFKIIMPGRRFIHEGLLTKISSTKVERERHFILFSDMLLWVRVYGKDKYELRKGIIPLRFFFFKNIPDNDTFENCWEIGRNDTDQKWILCAKERKTKSMWLQVLGEVVEKLNRVSGFFRNSVAFKINTQHSQTTREQTNELLLLRDIQNKIEGLRDNLADNPNRKFKREVRALVDDEERYLFLFNDRLLITRMKSQRKYTVKTDISLSDGQVVAGDIPDCEPYMINRIAIVRHGNKKFRTEIIFETPEEKMIWLTEFDQLRSDSPSTDSSSNIIPPSPQRTMLSSSSSGSKVNLFSNKFKRSNTSNDIIVTEASSKKDEEEDVGGDKKKQRKWDDDSSTTNCTACAVLFTTTNRKHHCRNCGHIFCNSCTGKKAYLPHFGYSKKKVRVCDKCFIKPSPQN